MAPVARLLEDGLNVLREIDFCRCRLGLTTGERANRVRRAKQEEGDTAGQQRRRERILNELQVAAAVLGFELLYDVRGRSVKTGSKNTRLGCGIVALPTSCADARL